MTHFSSSTRPAPHLLTALAPLLRGGPDTLHARADLAKISIFGFFSLFYCCPAVPANLACANHHRGKKLVLLFTAQSKLPGNSSPAVRNDWTQALRTPATRRILQSSPNLHCLQTQTHMHGTPKVRSNILTETQATSKFKQPSVTNQSARGSNKKTCSSGFA